MKKDHNTGDDLGMRKRFAQQTIRIWRESNKKDERDTLRAEDTSMDCRLRDDGYKQPICPSGQVLSSVREEATARWGGYGTETESCLQMGRHKRLLSLL